MTLKISEIDNVQKMLEYATDIYSEKNKANYFYSDILTDLQCGIYINDETKKIIVSFRGTTSFEDKLADLDVAETKFFGKIKVHSGFYDQLFKSEVYHTFYNKFIELINSKDLYEIFITGHSLGAALASLFTFRLATSLDRKINIISFASPKVGNYYWKQAFDKNQKINNLRVMVSSDPIPLTPIGNYYHVANVLCLNSGKYLWYIEDHSTKMYMKLVQQKKLDIEYNNTPSVPVPCKIGRKPRTNKFKCPECGYRIFNNFNKCTCYSKSIYDPSISQI